MTPVSTSHDLVVFCDGASSAGAGAGGFGGVIMDSRDRSIFQFGGGHSDTTNNQMELCGAIFGLMHCKEVCDERKLDYKGRVLVVSDSEYVILGITKWVDTWIRNKWYTNGLTPVKNVDLWKKLIIANEKIQPKYQHVRGHRGIMGNEVADQIAKAWKQKAKEQPLDFWPFLNKLFE